MVVRVTAVVATSTLLAEIRAAVVAGLVADDLNVYAYPDPQVEYPAVVLPTFDVLALHASVGCEGVIVGWRFEVMVARGEVESAVAELEGLVVDVARMLEALESPAWSQVVVHRVDNVRNRTEAGAMSADLVLEIHA